MFDLNTGVLLLISVQVKGYEVKFQISPKTFGFETFLHILHFLNENIFDNMFHLCFDIFQVSITSAFQNFLENFHYITLVPVFVQDLELNDLVLILTIFHSLNFYYL